MRGGATMTKLRFFSVLLIAALGTYFLVAAVVASTTGMSDGGGL
jgi:hypothetical protein